MTGRYALETTKGTMLIEVAKVGDGLDVRIQTLQVGIWEKPKMTTIDGNKITVESVFFMFPKIVHQAVFEYTGDGYVVSGSYATIGEISGKAVLFTGKTKEDLMYAELPSKRTGKVVHRTDEEISREVDALMAKMTLEEKIGQMSQSAGNFTAAIGGDVDSELSLDEMIRRGMVGSVIAMTSAANIYEQQKIAVEESRLGIPLMFCQDVIHGKSTVFPIPLGWSCSFNPQLVGEAGRVAARESTPIGIMYAFSPMLDIARDPRWGRVSEGNGEDPYLCARICEAQVKGYQGNDLYDEDSMMACLKHFIGYSAAEGGRDYNTCEITETTLRNVYLPPFKAGVDAGAASVMNAFNTMNSVPVVVNKYILRDLLRNELGFDGVLVSDYSAVEEAIAHGAAESRKDAAVKAVKASMDIEMASTTYLENLKSAVESGDLDVALIDESVRRILTYKYKTGLMDDPFKYLQPEHMDRIFSEEHQEVSLRLARESAVLLKNDGVLPLKSGQSVAVIGPKGDSTDLLGPWQFSSYSDQTVTLKQGLEKKGVKVYCEAGCDIFDEIEGGFERAKAAAAQADVIILALGEDMSMSGEASSRQNIVVPQVQIQLAQEMLALNKPVVLVLTNGRPLLLDWFDQHMNAVLETWFLGSQAGNAIADVLVGDYNPSGKLTISFPRNQGQIPIYYNHFSTGRPYTEGMADKFRSRYLDGPNTPLYTFGYGLSYTTFAVEDLQLSADTMTDAQEIKASVRVTNTGSVQGTEVIQLYIHDVAASIARPVKELKGFEKVTLKPGESTSVVFTVDEPMLRFFGFDNRLISEAGTFELMVGTSSDDRDLLKKEFTLVK